MAKIKISGAEYKAIQALPWPEAWYVDECLERVNDGDWAADCTDHTELNDSDVVEIDGGAIVTTDESVRPPRGGYVGWIKRELAKLTERRIVVTCDAAKLEAVIAAVRAAGGAVA